MTNRQLLLLPETIEFKKVFEESGAEGQVQAIIDSSGIDATPPNGKLVAHLFNEADMEPINDPSAAHPDISDRPSADVTLLPVSAAVDGI